MPIFMVRVLIALVISIVFSMITVVNLKADISTEPLDKLEDTNRELSSQIEAQKVQIEKLKTDIQNQKYRFLDMNWIWEFNLAEIRTQYTKVFDYFVRGKEDPILWKDRPEEIKNGDKRAIGAIEVDYKAKIGIDLKSVLVSLDRGKKTVKYWVPEPRQTGGLEPDDHWQVRTTLEYSKGEKFGMVRRNDWRWLDEESKNTALPLWEKEKTKAYKRAFASKTFEDQLGQALRAEADRRIKGFLETLLDCQAIPVQKHELQFSESLGTALPALLQEASMQNEQEQINGQPVSSQVIES